MTTDVYERLKPCVKDKKLEQSVFTWEDGSAVRDFRVAWDKMCAAAKVPILLHDFRRSAIRNMIRAGVSEKTAMQISGHVTRSVFDRYDFGSDADLADAAEKIENRRIGRKLVTETRNAESSEASR